MAYIPYNKRTMLAVRKNALHNFICIPPSLFFIILPIKLFACQKFVETRCFSPKTKQKPRKQERETPGFDHPARSCLSWFCFFLFLRIERKIVSVKPTRTSLVAKFNPQGFMQILR